MVIGVVVATESEKKVFLEVFGRPSIGCSVSFGYTVFVWQISFFTQVVLIQSGIGEIAAASSTQCLIDHFKVEKIINYGVVGGLTDRHLAHQIGIVEKVVHYDFDISVEPEYLVGEYPEHGVYIEPAESAISEDLLKGLPRFTCASADKIVAGGIPKQELSHSFGADICDMESAGIVITCNRNQMPCTLIKAVSDEVDEDMDAYYQNVATASKKCVELIAQCF